MTQGPNDYYKHLYNENHTSHQFNHYYLEDVLPFLEMSYLFL